MIEQNVQVLRCDKESLWVRIGTQSGCTACDNGQGCGAGLFAKLIRRKPVILELARNEMNVEAGQMLTLAFPEQVYLKLVFASYGWPLIAALAGALAGYSLTSWAGLQALAIDAATLSGGVLAAWVTMRFFRSRDTAETILNSLHMTICNPSNTPNMCTGMVKKPEHH
jgi:sigma-E factor negative regulatory protein RseC